MERAEKSADPREYLHLLRRRWWLVAVAVALSVGVRAFLVFRMTPIYQAATTVLIESKYPNVIPVGEVLGADPEAKDYFKTQLEIIGSRSVARMALRELYGESGASVLPPEGSEGERLMVDFFLGNLRIAPKGKTRIVSLAFRSPDPETAARAANTVADVYIRQNLQSRLDATRDAGSWLGTELEEARTNLEEAEKKLQRYKEERNLLSYGEQRASISRRIDELGSQASLARAEREELQSRYRALKALVEQGRKKQRQLNALPDIVNNGRIQGLLAEEAALGTKLQALLEIYTPRHPEVLSQKARIAELEARIFAEEKKVVESLRHSYELARQKETRLEEMVAKEKKRALDLDGEHGEYAALEKEVESSRLLYAKLEARMNETDLAGGLRTNNVRVIDRAEIPREPVEPNKQKALILALLVGVFGGVGLAFFLESLDQSVRSPNDLEAAGDMPFLGPIPLLDGKATGGTDLIALTQPNSPWSEAFKAIRTSLLFASPDNPPKSLMVTSAGQGEGKTFVAANLAVKMAMAGKRVLLVNADMRKPRQHTVFNVRNDAGLSSVLTSQNDVNAVLKGTKVPNLQLLTAGPPPPNPSELLGSERMGQFAALLGKRYDRVIFDTPPLITVTDAAVLAARLDGVVFVVKAGATGREILRRSRQRFDELGANVLGVILNWMDMRGSAYYSYYSSYYSAYYGDEKKKKTSGKNNGGKRGRARSSARR